MHTVLFDLGNVLIRFSHERMCRQMGELCGRSEEAVHALLIDSGLQWNYERGRLTEEEFHAEFERLTGCELERDELRRAAGDIFEPQPGMDEIVSALHASGRRLVLLSNTCATHFEWVRSRYRLLDPFAAFVLSYEVGAIKPEAPIYEAALQAIDCAPGECFYTDDRAEHVAAAREFGLDAEVFTGVVALRRHLQRRATIRL